MPEGEGIGRQRILSPGGRMNHALLPSIRDASLPVKYEAARLALSECNRIDECKGWADKTAALASYAKQAENKELERTAMRIRARAIRRCGELLREIEAKAHRGKGGGAPPQLSERRKAADEAGLSEDQAKTALRVANINGKLFEEQIESDDPPTITALAEQGKGKANGVPHYVQRGITIKAFQAGMYFRGHLRDLAERTKEFDPQDVVDGSTHEERNDIRRNIETIDRYLDQLMAKL
jgi:hypothetical protein